MKNHYTEADLLETYYMQPDEASDIIAHVNECNECQTRYRRLAEKLRDAAACPSEKPATFWTRQRMLITRAADNARRQSATAMRAGRIAAAAMLAFILGGAVVYKTVQPKEHVVVVQTATNQAPADDLQVQSDPWQSDELKDFGNVVQWESWVDPKSDRSSL